MSNELLFRAIVGSQSFGTNIETSDIDYKGIYLQPLKEVLSLRKYKKQEDINKDDTNFEIGRY